MITPSQAKDIAKRTFLSFYPEEEIWFDVAWDALSKGRRKGSIQYGGSTADFVAIDGPSHPSEPRMVEIVAELVNAFGIERPTEYPELISLLRKSQTFRKAKYAGPSLEEVAYGFVEEILKQSCQNPNTFYITVLKCGKLKELNHHDDFIGGPLSEYDLVVDEISESSRIPAKNPPAQRLMELSDEESHVLWLILTHPGRELQYEFIAKIRGFPYTKDSDCYNRINGIKSRCNHWLGAGLCKRIFEKAQNQRYLISLAFSFFWKRYDFNKAKSKLLRR